MNMKICITNYRVIFEPVLKKGNPDDDEFYKFLKSQP